MVTASPLFFDFTKHCPQPSCGEQVQPPARFCPHCGSGLITCPTCQATNRLLACHCRACCAELTAEVWPTRAGLAHRRVKFNTISRVEAARAPLRLGAEVLAAPVAADGLIVVPLANGTITLVSDFVSQVIGQIQAGGQLVVTPALHRGSLYAATGKRVLAFDLGRFLDQQSRLEPRPVWMIDLAGQAVAQPLLADDAAVYALSREDNQMALHARATGDGRPLWPQPTRFPVGRTLPPALIDGRLLVITEDGLVNIVNAADGRVQAVANIGQPMALEVGPFVVGNRALVVNARNDLIEILLTDAGPLINHLYSHDARIAALAANEEYIALGHIAGVALLDARGHELWSNNQMESVSVAPIIAGRSLFALDDAGNGLLFDVLNANPVARVRLLAGDVSTPPLLTHTKVAAVSAAGDLALLGWG